MGTSLPINGRKTFRGHLPALDGVRGLAILMVIGSHAFYSDWANKGTFIRWVGDLLAYGLFGVDLFFVLSGFLITGILVDSLSDGGFFRKFYARRVLRIFPLYYGVLLILFLLTPLLHLHWRGMGWLMLGYLQNVRPAEVGIYSPGAGIALNHFWSLAVEEQFYLVWPAAVFFVRGRRRLLAMTLAVSLFALTLRLVLIGVGVGPHLIHVTTITRADTLLLGGTFALLFRSAYWPTVQRWAGTGFIATVALVGASIFLLPREFPDYGSFSLASRLWLDGVRYTILAVGSACLIAWSLRAGSRCAWFFELGWMRFFGKYSYGIYVLHMLVFSVVLQWLRAAILQQTHSKILAVAGAGFLSLALSVAAAYVCFYLYEKPFLRLKQYFDYLPPRKQTIPVGAMPENPTPARRMAPNLINLKSFKKVVSLR